MTEPLSLPGGAQGDTAPAVMAHLKQHLGSLPSMPAVRAELLRCLTQDDPDLSTVARLVMGDQVIAAKVLRVANSSFFGLPTQVESVTQAVTLLGFSGLQSVALASVVMDTFQPNVHTAWFAHDTHWRHTMATATCAQVLAAHLRMNESTAFTAGLLHDMGRLVMLVCCPGPYRSVCDWSQTHDVPMVDAERRVLGFDHGQAGGVLAQAWRLPPAIAQSMAMHHRAHDPEACDMAKLVHVADALAHALDLDAPAPNALTPAQDSAWAALNIDWDSASSLVPVIQKRYRQTCDSLLS